MIVYQPVDGAAISRGHRVPEVDLLTVVLPFSHLIGVGRPQWGGGERKLRCGAVSAVVGGGSTIDKPDEAVSANLGNRTGSEHYFTLPQSYLRLHIFPKVGLHNIFAFALGFHFDIPIRHQEPQDKLQVHSGDHLINSISVCIECSEIFIPICRVDSINCFILSLVLKTI